MKNWSNRKKIIVGIVGLLIMVVIGSFLPPPFSPNTNYKVDQVSECEECYPSWYLRVSNENSGYIISVDSYNTERQSCKVGFNYKKTNELLHITFEDTRHVSNLCLSQFEGTYSIIEGKWSNGDIRIGNTSEISLY